MKEKLVNFLRENAIMEGEVFYRVQREDGMFSAKKTSMKEILRMMENAKKIDFSKKENKEIVLDDKVNISLSSLNEILSFPTYELDNFTQITDKYNPLCFVYYRFLEEEGKEFLYVKLGDFEKKLELIKDREYVYKLYKNKYIKCQSKEELEKHIKENKFFNSQTVAFLRDTVLKITKIEDLFLLKTKDYLNLLKEGKSLGIGNETVKKIGDKKFILLANRVWDNEKKVFINSDVHYSKIYSESWIRKYIEKQKTMIEIVN